MFQEKFQKQKIPKAMTQRPLKHCRKVWSLVCLFSLGFQDRPSSFAQALLLPENSNTRRDFVVSTATIIGTASMPFVTNAATMPMPLPSTEPRNVDVGGGFDLLRTTNANMPFDVMYPPSMEGLWVCSRIPTSVEGDLFQAQEVWKALGGVGTLALTSQGTSNANKPETYLTRFLKPTTTNDVQGVVNDRGFELLQRRKQSQEELPQVIWTLDQPNVLKYSMNTDKDKFVALTVKSRTIELPSETTGGFGSNELICIEEDREGGLASLAGSNGNKIIRAAQIKRRFRRSYDEQGNRVVEGLELIKTYRVLDGVAGTEFPTSTVKSQLRLVRPPSQSSS